MYSAESEIRLSLLERELLSHRVDYSRYKSTLDTIIALEGIDITPFRKSEFVKDILRKTSRLPARELIPFKTTNVPESHVSHIRALKSRGMKPSIIKREFYPDYSISVITNIASGQFWGVRLVPDLPAPEI